MKFSNYIGLLLAGVLLFNFNSPAVAAETKRVCVKQTDAKTKKVQQVCRQVKIHKKLDGNKVPPKTPK